MADSEDPAEAAVRLEEALERIAALARRPLPAAPQTVLQPEGAMPDVDAARMAARLDALISQIRAALGVSADR